MMSKKKITLSVFLILITLSRTSVITGQENDLFLVKLKNIEQVNEIATDNSLEIIRIIEEINTIVVRDRSVYSNMEMERIVYDERVIFVERDDAISVPRDEVYSEITSGDSVINQTDDQFWGTDPATKIGQWNMRVLNLEKAWSMETGEKNVVVAVVDSGIAYDHPEIENMYIHGGYDWINDDDDPYDDNGHGSWVSGIIAAEKNNHIGIAGIAKVSIMAEKVLNSNGGGTISNLILGIIHAADSGADIISLSLGTGTYSQALKDAIDYANGKGCLLIAAAGNRGQDDPHYPGTFEEVLCVTATYGEPVDSFAPYSNYGSWIDISAPGGWDDDGDSNPSTGEYWIISISNHPDTYMYGTGTSGAVPHVSGIAALCLSKFPSLTNDELKHILIESSEDKGLVGWDMFYGHGRVNAEQALLMTPSQSVGGEAKIIDSIDEISETNLSTSLIMFGTILTLIMVGIVPHVSTNNIKKIKIQLYKRDYSHIRGI